MNILFIGDYYVLQALKGNVLHMVTYFVNHIPNTRLVYSYGFHPDMLSQVRPDIIYFVHVGRMDNPDLLQQCRKLDIPLCLMSIDLFRARDIIQSETFPLLDAMLGPVKCDKLYAEYQRAHPNLIIHHFFSRYVNTDIYHPRDVPKIYDIVYYGSNDIKVPRNLSDITDEYYTKNTVSTENPTNFYPFRKRIYELLHSKGEKQGYRMKLLEPRCEATCTVRDEELSTLLNQSYLCVATCSRADYLFTKHLEIPASECTIVGTCPSDYKDLFEDNHVQLTEDMTDEEILRLIDQALIDKENLHQKAKLFGKKIRDEHNYAVAMTEFIQITKDIIDQYRNKLLRELPASYGSIPLECNQDFAKIVTVILSHDKQLQHLQQGPYSSWVVTFKYMDVCKRSTESDEVFTIFKSEPDFTVALEHPNYSEQGRKFLQVINTMCNRLGIMKLPWDTICQNDTIGNPEVFPYELDIHSLRNVSPTTLRYVHTGLNILKHLEPLYRNKPVNIVEIGGAYGGQCLILFLLAPLFGVNIQSYVMYELPYVSSLQQKYLSRFTHLIPTDRISYRTFNPGDIQPSHPNSFLISNYCLSEAHRDIRKQYYDHLFPCISHGYLSWNYGLLTNAACPEIAKYPQYVQLPEIPRTGPNLEIRF